MISSQTNQRFDWQDDDKERLSLAWLTGYDKISLKKIKQMLKQGRKPSELCRSLSGERADLDWLEKQLKKNKLTIILAGDDRYPVNLLEVESYPLVLFARGMIEPVLDVRAAAVVGTRKPTSYGIYWGGQVSRLLLDYGWTVVSGLAFGIDGVAHKGVLEGGGRTIAVLPGGIDKVYPASHQSLAEEIVEKGGCLISEVGPGVKVANRGAFPRRNRIIAGLSRFLVVVEGGQKSGTLTTASFMVGLGRDVWALPGRIDNQQAWAPNFLIQNGANPIISLEDFEKVLAKSSGGLAGRKQEIPDKLDDELKAVFMKLDKKGQTVDELAEGMDWQVTRILQVLSRLELLGFVRVLSDGRYVRV
ncbi:MAG: DNA-protecting protein DprA [bacterium]|nr:DNA-protecting protein DprA [bacterium]